MYEFDTKTNILELQKSVLAKLSAVGNFRNNVGMKFKGILWDFFIFTLEQIIVLNKYCTYKTNLFPKYHISEHYQKHYRTCVRWDTKKK